MVGAGLLAGGCGSGSGSTKIPTTTPAALRLQRGNLAYVANGLLKLERPIRAEVAASRVVWGSVASGLPRTIPEPVLAGVSAASAKASALPKPRFLGKSKELTGPAAGIAGLYESFDALSRRGWKLIDAAAVGTNSERPAAARFLRANVWLYISSVYDAHFNLAAIAKNLRRGFTELGGSAAFGGVLTPAEVERVADVYGPDGALLEPHPHLTIGR